MPDVFTKEKRSEVMSRIRSTGSKIELKMKAALEDSRIGFQYQPDMFGKPDFLIPPGIVVFCDSSFWHGRNWSKLRKELSSEYWYKHIKRNRLRDRKVNRELEKEGFSVLRFWDDQIDKEMAKCILQIKEALQHRAGALPCSNPTGCE